MTSLRYTHQNRTQIKLNYFFKLSNSITYRVFRSYFLTLHLRYNFADLLKHHYTYVQNNALAQELNAPHPNGAPNHPDNKLRCARDQNNHFPISPASFPTRLHLLCLLPAMPNSAFPRTHVSACEMDVLRQHEYLHQRADFLKHH